MCGPASRQMAGLASRRVQRAIPIPIALPLTQPGNDKAGDAQAGTIDGKGI